MRHVLENLLDRPLTEQRSALGLATRTEVLHLATGPEQMLTTTARAPNAREAALGAAALQVLVDDPRNDAAQEAVLVLAARA